jgi:hypothetical protein
MRAINVLLARYGNVSELRHTVPFRGFAGLLVVLAGRVLTPPFDRHTGLVQWKPDDRRAAQSWPWFDRADRACGTPASATSSSPWTTSAAKNVLRICRCRSSTRPSVGCLRSCLAGSQPHLLRGAPAQAVYPGAGAASDARSRRDLATIDQREQLSARGVPAARQRWAGLAGATDE